MIGQGIRFRGLAFFKGYRVRFGTQSSGLGGGSCSVRQFEGSGVEVLGSRVCAVDLSLGLPLFSSASERLLQCP